MSDIVLSASVRQNLLSLQSTADLLSTTQNRLATGKKVNTALDNPTNYFTAASLDNRASDISNLLDGIGNGVQVLQAANTGITSLQKLVDSAKSVANQALQASVGYSTKSSISATITGATADDLRGTSTFTDTTASAGTAIYGASAAVATTATVLSAMTDSTGGTSGTGIANNDTLTINGKTITFQTGTGALTGSGNAYTLGIGTTVGDLVNAINTLQGGSAASTFASGQFTLHTGTDADLSVTGSTGVLAKLGLSSAGANTATRGTSGGVSGLTLSFGAVGSSGAATTVTFGDGTGGTVKSLNDLNSKLSADNLLATIDSTGKLTITTTNDAASSAIGTVTGTAAGAGKAFENASTGGSAATGGAPIQDAAALAVRANLVSQYNNILDQITSTSQDSSFNGVNLLNGDQLKLTFNETGKSTLKIQGVTFNSAGLGLSALTAGTDFLDNSSANNVISSLDKASSTLRTEASALGSNLSIVQIRQDFSKNLINVLQTGSSNLTLADTNEEAANSQALSTRQSIAVSALALANQSQQSVLQLLR